MHCRRSFYVLRRNRFYHFWTAAGKGATSGAKGAEAPLSQVKVEKKDKKF